VNVGIDMHIEIITTPNRTLKETGFGSFLSCRTVLNSIKKSGHSCRLNSCESLVDLQKVIARAPDLVVLAVKYIVIDRGEKIWLSEFFDENFITYSGSSKKTLKFDSDKILAKLYLREKGVPTADFFTASVGEFKRDEDLSLRYPLFLKPAGAANGNGIDEDSYVSSFEEYEKKILSIQKQYGQPILVEEYLSGGEFTVAVMNKSNGELVVSAVEVVPPKSSRGHRILSEDVKSENAEKLKKITDNDVKKKVCKMACDVFIKLGVEGFARVDIKSNRNGECFFMEVNLVPGMPLGTSYFPEACRIDNNLSYDQTVSTIVDSCLDRKVEKKKAYFFDQKKEINFE